MGTVVVFTLIMGGVLTVIYGVYKVLLEKETFHRFNRLYILAGYALAACLAALFLFARQPAHASLPTIIYSYSYAVPNVATDHATHIGNLLAGWAIMAALIVYVAGLSFFAVREIYLWRRMYRIIHSGTHSLTAGGWQLVLHDNRSIAPFSWYRYIVMSQHDYDTAGDIIIAHEEKHLQYRHWTDLLIAETVAVLLWYNPAGWLLRNELQSIHEYEADEAVLKSGIDAHTYQLLLIKKAVGTRFPSIANSLNHSNLKKRITMMLRKKSNTKGQWRAIAALPALALAALLLTIPAVADGLQRVSDTQLVPASTTGNNATDRSSKDTTSAMNYQVITSGYDTTNVKIFVGNKEITPDDMNKISPDDIANINVEKYEDRKIITLTLKGDENAARQGIIISGAYSFSFASLGNDTLKGNVTYIRQSQPVYVVDGKVVESIDELTPDDIASITVYKDSSDIVKKYNALGKGLLMIQLKK